jgi:hypothetical protein
VLSADDYVVWVDVGVWDQLRGLFHQQCVSVALSVVISVCVCGIHYCSYRVVARYTAVVDEV